MAARPESMLLYNENTFLDAAQCERIRLAMDAGEGEQAEILDGTIEPRDQVRRAWSIEPQAAIIHDVEQRLDSRRDAIAQFFRLDLTEREGAGFVRYPAGGFYAPHRDQAADDSWPDAARRAVAVIVFLNGSTDGGQAGEFAGGTLRLFAHDEVIEVHPRQGLLVAFPADLLHEVTEVRDGVRDAIVDWFYGGRGADPYAQS
jgi:predicted 2-oxoglutarate/Fe(II)-dependent dioxygenase YbiX